MNTHPSPDLDAIKAIIAERSHLPGAMLPILHAIQHAVGYIPFDAVLLIADGLNVSRAEVHGVITYYTHFRQQPAGRHVVQLCRAEACQARGADALAQHATDVLGCDFQQTTADGGFTLEPVYCLGQCACGPAIMIDNELHARVTPARFDALLQAKRGAQ